MTNLADRAPSSAGSSRAQRHRGRGRAGGGSAGRHVRRARHTFTALSQRRAAVHSGHDLGERADPWRPAPRCCRASVRSSITAQRSLRTCARVSPRCARTRPRSRQRSRSADRSCRRSPELYNELAPTAAALRRLNDDARRSGRHRSLRRDRRDASAHSQLHHALPDRLQLPRPCSCATVSRFSRRETGAGTWLRFFVKQGPLGPNNESVPSSSRRRRPPHHAGTPGTSSTTTHTRTRPPRDRRSSARRATRVGSRVGR